MITSPSPDVAPFAFPSPALVKRIEAAEGDLAASCARLAVAAGEPGIVLPLGGGSAVFARAGSPVNKSVGVGLDGAIDPRELDAVEAALGERGEGVRVELASMASPDAARALTERGYRLEGFENVLALPLGDRVGDGIEATGAIAVDPVDDLHPWMDVLLDGFLQPDDSPIAGDQFPREVLESVMVDFVRLDRLQRYLARIDEGDPRAVGGASMRLHDGVALLCGASTLPGARRRGVQRALLGRRLRDAKGLGADVAVIVTAPGSRSQANAMRWGFRLLYVRAILVRPPTPR